MFICDTNDIKIFNINRNGTVERIAWRNQSERERLS